jgi:hypothetical protein
VARQQGEDDSEVCTAWKEGEDILNDERRINSNHNNAGRRKGEITEIDQVAGVVESSHVCMRMKSTTINRPHNNAEGKETQ